MLKLVILCNHIDDFPETNGSHQLWNDVHVMLYEQGMTCLHFISSAVMCTSCKFYNVCPNIQNRLGYNIGEMAPLQLLYVVTIS